MAFPSSPAAWIEHVLHQPRAGSIEKNEICAICRETVYDPRAVACGHSFCRMCIRSHLSAFGDCPLCRKKLFGHYARPGTVSIFKIALRSAWVDFYGSIWYPISLLSTIVLLSGLLVYLEWRAAALMGGYGLILLILHLTIGLEKLNAYCDKYCPTILHDDKWITETVLPALLWSMLGVSTFLGMLALLAAILHAVVLATENPGLAGIVAGTITLMGFEHCLGLIMMCPVLGGFWLLPRLESLRESMSIAVTPPPGGADSMAEFATNTEAQVFEDAHDSLSGWDLLASLA